MHTQLSTASNTGLRRALSLCTWRRVGLSARGLLCHQCIQAAYQGLKRSEIDFSIFKALKSLKFGHYFE